MEGKITVSEADDVFGDVNSVVDAVEVETVVIEGQGELAVELLNSRSLLGRLEHSKITDEGDCIVDWAGEDEACDCKDKIKFRGLTSDLVTTAGTGLDFADSVDNK